MEAKKQKKLRRTGTCGFDGRAPQYLIMFMEYSSCAAAELTEAMEPKNESMMHHATM